MSNVLDWRSLFYIPLHLDRLRVYVTRIRGTSTLLGGCGELEQAFQSLTVRDPDQSPLALLTLELGRLPDDLPRAVLVFVERVCRGDLDALPEGRVRVLHEQGTVEAVAAQEAVAQLPGGVARAGQSGEVACAVAWRVDDVEGAVAEEVQLVGVGAQRGPFVGRRGGRW